MSIPPAPINVKPNGEFLGNDGSWSMFEIKVGVPAQNVRVLPSTELSQTLVVIPAGCSISSGDPSNCTDARGGTYDSTKSSNWTSKNIFPLNVEVNLGLIHNSDNGAYGYDEISIPTPGGKDVTMDQQLISGVATKDFFLGSLGLSSSPIQFQDPPDTRQSLITSLKDGNMIPSLAYGYTAGASYRNQTGSLTLGGYDASRFVPNDVSIEFSDTPTRQFVVALKSITYSDSETSDGPLLTDGILSLVDTTVPTIWLPLDVCTAFENAFGISYDPISNLYLVNSTLHDDLVKQNASVTFELGTSVGTGPSLMITLPYSSFDLDVGYPLVPKTKPTRYFPLKRAADSTQYTLGRTLLQEAYLIVDYESRNFSVSQAIHTDAPAQVVAISTSNATESSSTPSGTSTIGPVIVKSDSHHSGFPTGAIAGIVIAVVLIALGIAAFFFRKHRNKNKRKHQHTTELPADPLHPRHHQEVDATHERKEGVETDAYAVTGMESPRLEMGDDRVTFEGYYDPKRNDAHGAPTELPSGYVIEPINRSELSSPEPISRQASPTPYELATAEPQCAEMATPVHSAQPSPRLEGPSALSSPRSSRPLGHPWRPASYRVDSGKSDASGLFPMQGAGVQRNGSQNSGFSKDGTPIRPAHIRKDSNDSGFTQETTTSPVPRPSSMRQDSTESGFNFDTQSARRPPYGRINSNNSNISDPLISPQLNPHHPHPFHDPEPMQTPLEEETDQESPLIGPSEPQTAVFGRRGSANLISQKSPPASPSMSSIPRKEVPSTSSSHSHRRQESSTSGGPPSAFSSPHLGSRMRSGSHSSKFEEKFEDEPRGSFDLGKKS